MSNCPCCGQGVRDLDIILDEASGVVSYGDKETYLTHIEMMVFKALVSAYPRVVLKNALFDLLYQLRPADDDVPQPKIIDVWVCKVRRKVHPLGLIITTSWGRGYSLTFAKPEAAKELIREGLSTDRTGLPHCLSTADQAEIRRLHESGLRLTQIGATMRLPYRTVYNAMQKLGLLQVAA